MIIGIFFFFITLKILKANYHKRKIVVQVRNLFLKFEITLIFFVKSKKKFVFWFTKKLDHIRIGGKSLNNLHIGT
jgi:hypothetical protein